MKKGLRENLEFRYLIFVGALLAVTAVPGIFTALAEQESSGAILRNSALSSIGICIIAVLFWMLLRRTLIRPMKALEKIAASIAAGDLTAQIEITGADGAGATGATFNNSLRSLSAILQRVKNGSQRVIAVTGQMKAEFKNISENTKLEAESVADIAASVEEMNSASAEIAGNAEQLAASTEEKAASMHEMAASISQVANSSRELSSVVDSTASSIEELSQTIREVAGKTEELAAASEDTLAAAEEISASVKEVEQSARESAALSVKVKNDAVFLGIASVEKTVEGIREIKSSFEKTAGCIKKLEVRSEEIGKILNVIDEITEQTTLLALNAAILAAQAGEHGKGFSVVADEIKDLADRTSFSTHEISKLIQSVQQEVHDATFAMEDGLTSVESGLRVAKDAGDALDKVVQSSKQSAEMSESIERSTAEQAKSTRLVSESMERVKHMVAQVARTTQEQSKGALLITKATEKMRTVAAHVSSATGEQLINTRHISDAMELVSAKSGQIARAVNEQLAGSRRIFDSIEKIKDIPKGNMERVAGINRALSGLSRNAQLLMGELRNLRLPDEHEIASGQADSLKMGIEPVGMSPEDAPEKFHRLASYLAGRLGLPVELRVVSDFEGALRDIERGITDICFMAPMTYIAANRRYGMQVVAKALKGGKSTSRSVIVARNDSGIKLVKDLRGRTFAFGDPNSVSGYLAPKMVLLNSGISMKDLLYYEYAGDDEEVVQAVAAGRFDAGGISEEAAEGAGERGLSLIGVSAEFPGNVIGVSKALPDNLRSSIVTAFSVLGNGTESSSVIAGLPGCSGFEIASQGDFAQMQGMMEEAGELERQTVGL